MRSRLLLLAISTATILQAPAYAQEASDSGQLRPFCADRPGKATPPCILDAGHMQFETAIADWSNGSAADHGESEAFAAFEARFGLTGGSEAELAWTPVSRSRSPGGPWTTGVGDLTLSARTALTSPDASGPAVSIEPFVQAPTGANGQGAGRWGGGVSAPMSFPLPDGFSLGFTPALQAATAPDRPGSHLEVTSALGLSRGVADLTFGAELWGAVEPHVERTRQATLDLFTAWAPAKLHDVQFDLGVNAGLTRYAPRVEISLGAARRF